jgi:hypothetical protein
MNLGKTDDQDGKGSGSCSYRAYGISGVETLETLDVH